MTALANIKPSSILLGSTEAEYDAGNFGIMATLDAAVGIDVSTAGSPGQLAPYGKIPGTEVQRWADRSSGITVGFPTFTMLVRPPFGESRVTRVSLKYVSPTLAVTAPATGSGIQPAPTKAYELTFNGEFIVPERSTRLERIKFVSRVLSLLVRKINASDAAPTDFTVTPVHAAIIDGEPAY